MVTGVLFRIVYVPVCGNEAPHANAGVVVKLKSHVAIVASPVIFDGAKQVVVALAAKLTSESINPVTSNLS